MPTLYALALQPDTSDVPVPPEGYLDQLLSFFYTVAHWAGGVIVGLLDSLLPLQTPQQLTDPIGFLALITVVLVVAEVAKKLAWLVVVAGWALIAVRVAMEVLQG